MEKFKVYTVKKVIDHRSDGTKFGERYVQLELSNGVTIENDLDYEFCRNLADKDDFYYEFFRMTYDADGEEDGADSIGFIRDDDYFRIVHRYWEVKESEFEVV